MKRVLIVEDDCSLAELVEIHLKDLGCKVTIHHNGNEGLTAAQESPFDLIILDIMLPGLDGTEVLKKLRANSNYVPILMLTSKSEELDKVLGLELGADDYMTKPFSIRELIARVKALFRRIELLTTTEPGDEPVKKSLSYQALLIDPNKRKVMLNGERLSLTTKEFDLLYLLASNPGKNFTREDILNRVWDYNFSGYEHTVNSHINRLRAKIEKDMNNPRFILTAWGFGYRFAEISELNEGNNV